MIVSRGLGLNSVNRTGSIVTYGLGLGFEITAEIITPVTGGGGGGYWEPVNIRDTNVDKYIRITVRYKGKEWVSIKNIDDLLNNSLVIIDAAFIKYTMMKAIIKAKFNKVINIINIIQVKAKRK